MDASLSKLAAKVTPAIEVEAMRASPPFRAGMFYLMRSHRGANTPAHRLAGPFNTAQEADESREVIGVRDADVCRAVADEGGVLQAADDLLAAADRFDAALGEGQ